MKTGEKPRRKFIFSPAEREEIIRKYGDRGARALDAVTEGRVKKYRDFFVVVGRSDEYVVEDEFCTCRDSVFRGGGCSHILAVRIARERGAYEEIDLWYLDDLCL
ncbi:MAG: SWIM zinc finger family protein [Methanoregulaceae archaeon]|nr:SWIM zinc finger family protein [Methanoregulaceae archaeon]